MAKRIYTRWAIPPVLLVLWAGADWFSRVEVLSRTMNAVWSFLFTPEGRLVTMLCGFGWLAWLVFRPRVIWWEKIRGRLPRSHDQRLSETEGYLRSIEDVLNQLAKVVQEHNRDAEAKLIGVVEKLKAMPGISMRLDGWAEILEQANMAHTIFEYIQYHHSTSDVAIYPFSTTWRQEDHSDEAVRLGTDWLCFLEIHYWCVAAFCQTVRINVSEICTGELNERIKQLRSGSSEITGDTAKILLREHRNRIAKAMDDYATKFAKDVEAIATTS
jgi:hypothetical protein